MAKVKDQIAKLGMGTLVAGLKAVESHVSKKQYKRLIATGVAQLLALHPDFGAGKARRRARKVVGAKPVKRIVRAGKTGLKEGLETAAVAAASTAALKVASKLGQKVTDRMKESTESRKDEASRESTA
ncbi:MAG TPA: hypothetical protein VFH40_10295 [Gemmatimonadales bacterium]|jgi:hypothetical protein|nr:hypothetical protein [Gemmatimonadales bacterium]